MNGWIKIEIDHETLLLPTKMPHHASNLFRSHRMCFSCYTRSTSIKLLLPLGDDQIPLIFMPACPLRSFRSSAVRSFDLHQSRFNNKWLGARCWTRWWFSLHVSPRPWSRSDSVEPGRPYPLISLAQLRLANRVTYNPFVESASIRTWRCVGLWSANV